MIHIRRAAVLLAVLSLCSCAAKITLIDRTDGTVYTGTTDGSTMGGSGNATITIEGAAYAGPWVYQAKDGAFSLATMNSTTGFSGSGTSFGPAGTVNSNLSGSATTTGTSTALMQSAVGNGMINARAADGRFIRCVFTFNTLSNTGVGQCVRNDGRAYDLHLKR